MEKNWWEMTNVKRKGRNSFSIPKKKNARKRCNLQTMTRPHHSEEKEKTMRRRSTKEKNASSSTRISSSRSSSTQSSSTQSSSTQSSVSVVGEEYTTMEIDEISNDSNMEVDDGWVTDTDTSIERMRSSEKLSLDEFVFPNSVWLGNSNLVPLEFLPKYYSTPFSSPDLKSFPASEIVDSIIEAAPKAPSTLISNVVTRHGEPLALPNVSYENEFVEESETLRDHDFQLEPISPEQDIQVPDILDDVNNESQKQCEDSFAFSNAPFSGGFRVYDDSDEHTKRNVDEDDECNINNPFEATNTYETAVEELANSDSRKRKQKGKERNLSEGTIWRSLKVKDFGETQNFQIDYAKKQEKSRAYNRMNESIIKWKQKKERKNLLKYKSDIEDNFQKAQKIQSKEFQDHELDNNKIQTVSLQINKKVNTFTGVDNKRQQDASILNTGKSQTSTSLRRKYRSERWNSSENVDKIDRDDSFENVKNIQNEELQDYGSDCQEATTYQSQINNRIEFASIRNRSESYNQKKNHRNKIGNSLEDVGNFNREVNFDKAETPKKKVTPLRQVKLKFSNPIETLRRKKNTYKGGNLFDDIDSYDNEDSFEKVQNIHNEEWQDDKMEKNHLETVAHKINKKNSKHDNYMTHQDADITNRSLTSTSLGGKHKPDKNDNEYSFENLQNMHIGSVQNIYLMHGEKLNNNQPETAALLIKRKVNINRLLSFTSLRRKHKKGGRNLSEVKSDRDDSFENFQNIQTEEFQDDGMDNNQLETDVHKVNRKIDKHVSFDNTTQQYADITNKVKSSTSLRRKHKIDKNNRESSFENAQNIQNKELQNDEFNNNQSQTAALQIKRKIKINQEASILNRLQSSTFLRREHRTEERNFSDDVDNCDGDCSFESVKNIQNEESQNYKSDHQETVTHRRQTNNRVEFDNILNRSGNSNQKKEPSDKIRNSFENAGNCNRSVNFERSETSWIKRTPHIRPKLKCSNRIKTPRRKKHTNEASNSLNYMDGNDNEDSFEKVQNIQNELQYDEVDNNQSETAIHQINRIINKHVGVEDITQEDVNIINRSPNSTTLGRKHKPDKNDKANSFENFQNMQNKELRDNEFTSYILDQLQTDASQIKRKANKHGGGENKRQQCGGIPNRSKISTSLKRKHKNEGENSCENMDKNDYENGFENVQNIQNKLQDDEMDNKQPRTATHEIKRKVHKHVGAENITQQEGNITNRSQSFTSPRRKYRNEAEISLMKSFENVQKNQNDWDQAGSSFEDVNKRGDSFVKAQHNEAKKTNWPSCCIQESTVRVAQTFRILQPRFLDDVPIDSIQLLNMEYESEMKCHH